MSSLLRALHLDGYGDGLIVLGGLLFLVGLILLVRLVAALADDLTHRRTVAIRRRSLRLGSRSVWFLVLLTLLSTALAVVMAGAALRTYTVFTRQELTGTVETLDWRADEKILVVRFSEIRNGRTLGSQTYSLAGDAWELSAHILAWSPRATLLGLRTGYRLNQIKGVYQDAGDETTRPHRSYALRPGNDWAWSLLTRYGDRLPFVTAVYGNAVSRPAQRGEHYDVFVTTNGLSVRRREEPGSGPSQDGAARP